MFAGLKSGSRCSSCNKSRHKYCKGNGCGCSCAKPEIKITSGFGIIQQKAKHALRVIHEHKSIQEVDLQEIINSGPGQWKNHVKPYLKQKFPKETRYDKSNASWESLRIEQEVKL